MKIPREFMLFGTTWKVEQPSKVIVDKESVLGSCDPDKAIIQIRRNLKKELKELTFIHESTHSILLTLGYEELGRDEVFVERLSKAIHQVINTVK